MSKILLAVALLFAVASPAAAEGFPNVYMTN
jgi:hypothetical protein